MIAAYAALIFRSIFLPALAGCATGGVIGMAYLWMLR
jgi:hypothetical protein